MCGHQAEKDDVVSLLVSLTGFRSRARPPVVPGARYRAKTACGVTEVARVVSLVADTMGIEHVVFEITIQRSPHTRMVDRRTLNLTSFLARYPEALEAEPKALTVVPEQGRAGAVHEELPYVSVG